jgi:hypothetical protein
MTAPLPTTSFGSDSPRRTSGGGRELQILSSPLKRAHYSGDQGAGSEEEFGRSGDVGNRPVKKLKQEVTDEQEGEGLVARLFKYAWHFVSGVIEGRHLVSILTVLHKLILLSFHG